MKGFLITFTVVFFMASIMVPIVELLGTFLDMLKLNAAIVVSARSAIHNHTKIDDMRDVNIVIDHDEFSKAFKENFYLMLSQKNGGLMDKAQANWKEQVEVSVNPRLLSEVQQNIDDVKQTGEKFDCFEIKVKTPYQFKTALMNRFKDSIQDNFYLKIKRLQSVQIVN